jgi:hypothetical protein
MATLTHTGRRAYLDQLKSGVVHFAFGSGSDNWGAGATYNGNCPSNHEINLGIPFISAVSVRNLTTGMVGAIGDPEDNRDFFVDYNGGVVYVNANFAATGASLRITYNHGFNDENYEATDLITRNFHKLCQVKEYVHPDDDGTILWNGGKYSIVGGESDWLYVAVAIEATDMPTGVIREVGVFLNPTVVNGLPGGQITFTPNQVTDKGRCMLINNYPTITRNTATRIDFAEIFDLPAQV